MQHGSDFPVAEGESSAGQREFLTFALGAEEYAIDILRVQEIRGYDAVTAIAHAPDFVKGVINLRGAIVPIVDLRLKFSLGEVEYSPFTVVIILNLASRTVGVVVDGVSDVIASNEADLLPAPELSSAVGANYISGLLSVEERMLIVLDIERLMLAPDMALADEVAA